MRIATSGVSNSAFRGPVIGKITGELLSMNERAKRILVRGKLPDNADDLVGYSGFLTTAKLDANIRSIPTYRRSKSIIYGPMISS